MNDKALLASVVIPAKNAAKWLPEQLESLVGQVDAEPFEVIVSDNGSSDETPDVVHAFMDRLRITLVDGSGPASASYARNAGAGAAEGEFLLFCDADDIVSPNWVGAMTRAVQANVNVIAAGALHHEKFNSSDVLEAYGIRADPLPGSASQATVGALPSFAGFLPTIPGGNFAVSRAAYLELGGMDWSYPGGSEETDFAWRAQLAGMRIIGVPAAVVQYRLKTDGWGIMRQQRIQQYARVLLWVRFATYGMSGPSWHYSARMVLTSGTRFLLARAERDKLVAARNLGGNFGALQGMVRYRLLRRNPTPSIDRQR